MYDQLGRLGTSTEDSMLGRLRSMGMDLWSIYSAEFDAIRPARRGRWRGPG